MDGRRARGGLRTSRRDSPARPRTASPAHDLLTAVFFDRATATFVVVKRHYGSVLAAGGVVLVVMGVLVWTGELVALNAEAQELLDQVGLDVFSEL